MASYVVGEYADLRADPEMVEEENRQTKNAHPGQVFIYAAQRTMRMSMFVRLVSSMALNQKTVSIIDWMKLQSRHFEPISKLNFKIPSRFAPDFKIRLSECYLKIEFGLKISHRYEELQTHTKDASRIAGVMRQLPSLPALEFGRRRRLETVTITRCDVN